MFGPPFLGPSLLKGELRGFLKRPAQSYMWLPRTSATPAHLSATLHMHRPPCKTRAGSFQSQRRPAPVALPCRRGTFEVGDDVDEMK